MSAASPSGAEAAAAAAHGVTAAAAAADLDAVRRLFREYADWLRADICLQGFERELKGLPGFYAPPRGALLLARCGAETLGVVAMRPLDGDTCEMKRLYVRPQARRRGVARSLVEALLAAARSAGYRRMRLETLDRMAEAQRLYRKLGFAEIPAAQRLPSDHPIVLELALS